jgi:serine/threonine protein kinase
MRRTASDFTSTSQSAGAVSAQGGPGVLPKLDRYEFLAKVGEGGMSTVYKARHSLTGEIVAIKLLSPEVASKPVLLKRFEQEFQAASRLDHPGIVRSLDFGQSALGPYLVMEFVDGMSLGERIARTGKLPEAEAVRLIAQIAEALDYTHNQGVIHRDVKPDNILLNKEGRAKLTDLGLVKQVDGDLNLTRPGQGLGTPNFMAPEQFSSAKTIDRRCDIYGLGATLYQVITGELPFHADSSILVLRKKAFNELTRPRQLVPGLSEVVERTVLRAMSTDPSQRPATVADFIAELRGRRTRRPPRTPAPPTPTTTRTLSPHTPTARLARPVPSQEPAPQVAEPARSEMRRSPSPCSSPASLSPAPANLAKAEPEQGPQTQERWEWLLAAVCLAAAAAGFFVMSCLK